MSASYVSVSMLVSVLEFEPAPVTSVSVWVSVDVRDLEVKFRCP